MEQIYHNYEKWEDYIHGMWRKETSDNEKHFLDKAIDFTGDHKLYGEWMVKVTLEWKIACEQNLTDLSQNRRAWLGHAACCMGINCPEYITRDAWGYLTKKQQDDANMMADIAISGWEKRNGITEGYYAKELFDY